MTTSMSLGCPFDEFDNKTGSKTEQFIQAAKASRATVAEKLTSVVDKVKQLSSNETWFDALEKEYEQKPVTVKYDLVLSHTELDSLFPAVAEYNNGSKHVYYMEKLHSLATQDARAFGLAILDRRYDHNLYVKSTEKWD
eukprot:GFYU01002573.1.p1 GENE.GFYU01002573.1~~GFYU01002573.1.p1  ORF type:complete len:139 (+),score=39.95 GFYU01002573.1:123-539(+)